MKQKPGAGSRNRMAMLAAAGLVLLAAAGCDSSVDVKGPRIQLPTVPTIPTVPSGPTVTQTVPIAGVSGVSLRAVGYAQIAMGASESLVINAPESVIDLLTAEVTAGELVLDRDSGSYQGQASDIRYDITLMRLDRLAMEGVGRISAEGVSSNHFTVLVNGVGDVAASGRADRQDVSVSSLGSYRGRRLETRITEVSLGAGSAEVWATERIEGWVGTGCALEYWGDPVIDIRGRGTVTRMGAMP